VAGGQTSTGDLFRGGYPIGAAPQWRSEGHDGVNALYILLRYHDRSVEYGALESYLGPSRPSPAELARASAHFGLPVRETRMTLSELLASPEPVLVCMSGQGGESQRAYGLFAFRAGRDEVGYVRGGDARWHVVTDDHLASSWTRLALVPVRAQWASTLSLASCAIGVLLGVVGASKGRRWMRRRRGRAHA
jgi:hypothetical protein